MSARIPSAKPPRSSLLLMLALAPVAACSGSPDIARPSGTGAGTILTFTNGVAPTSQVSGTAEELNNATFGGSVSGHGLFVVVGAAGTIVTSPDGVNWTSQSSPTPLDLYGVVYADNEFIAVGGNDVAAAGVVLTGTPDGTTWTVASVTDSLAAPLTGITYANGLFVAVGDNQVMSSPDGINWNVLPTEPSGITGPTVDLYNTAYGNGLYVTVGTYNTTTSSQEIAYLGFIATSPDAAHWSILPYTSNYLSGITYGAGQFVAVGREGSILTSSDGTTWTAQSAPQLDTGETPYLISVVYAGNQFVATGNYVGINPSTGFILTSPDGKTWTMQPTGANLYGITFGVIGGVGTYVAVGGE
jgi:hypothetical protein